MASLNAFQQLAFQESDSILEEASISSDTPKNTGKLTGQSSSVAAHSVQPESLLEGSPVCIKIIDLDFRLRYMSAAGQQQLKISNIDSHYGEQFPSDLYPEPWKPLVTEHLEKAGNGETCSLECPVLDTEGVEVWYDTTFVPACDDQGNIQHVIVTSVNVTERRKAEEQSRKLQDELAHVSRIGTMGELATGIAHELNQPLAAIASYNHVARIIAESANPDMGKIQMVLAKSEDQVVRAGEIVRRMRDFVSKTESLRELTKLNSLITDVAKFVEPDMEQAGASLELDLVEPSPGIFADKIQIQQVLVNLIRNALEAMQGSRPRKAKVSVATSVKTDDSEIEVTVSDTGRGIAADELDKIFNSFFTTKQEGMGLGLPISRSIIEAHGGRLWARSNQGPGATFGFTIPMDDACRTGVSPTVYVVEDDASVRDSLNLILSPVGVSVRCFSNAIEFLNVVQQHGIKQQSCLIVDLQMPKMSGLTLLEKVAELKLELPTIVVTGHGTPALQQRANDLNAIAFLEKPFRPSEIHQLISECFNQSDQPNKDR